jgi:cytochrome c oxidase assembly protein subunit 15
MALDPLLRNLTENMTTVQFDHRLLALATFLAIVIYWAKARKSDLPPRAAKASNALLHTAALQVALGISTLLLSVPTFLAAAHQATALLLLSAAVFLSHSLRKVPM